MTGMGNAQECPGGLGDNLFTAGDFGVGSSFVLELDPMLAPGYQYNRTGPPNDGQYMITNDVADWNRVWDTWLVIGDNSSDPNGYMMVVNASFEPGLFYEETIDGLCDNTTYEFSADIINMIKRGVTDHSDPNVVFLLNDDPVLNTGNIDKNERWNTYSFSFDTEPGQTSVKLSLRNNAPGGIGNDLALDNISFRACGPRSEISLIDGGEIICEEDLPIRLIATLDGIEDANRIYQWEVSYDNEYSWLEIDDQNGSQLTFSDIGAEQPFFRFSTAASAASFANEKCRYYSDVLSVQISKRTYEIFDTICGGTILNLGTADLINPGLYQEELISSKGCDSIVMIHLDTVRREVLNGILDFQDPGCYGTATGQILGREVSGGYPPYHLEVEDLDYDGLLAENLLSGSYNVLIEDRFNCFISTSVELIDPEKLSISLGPDLNLILGEEIDLLVEHNQELENINWSGISSEFTDQSAFTLLPFQDVDIIVTAKTIDGCEDRDTLKVRLDTDISIYVPNIFSPNDDRVNDQYIISPFGKSLGGINFFLIYDRWGGVMWKYQEGNEGWNGLDPSGKLVSPGIYPFILEGVLINGDVIKESGTITVVN